MVFIIILLILGLVCSFSDQSKEQLKQDIKDFEKITGNKYM